MPTTFSPEGPQEDSDNEITQEDIDASAAIEFDQSELAENQPNTASSLEPEDASIEEFLARLRAVKNEASGQEGNLTSLLDVTRSILDAEAKEEQEQDTRAVADASELEKGAVYRQSMAKMLRDIEMEQVSQSAFYGPEQRAMSALLAEVSTL